MEDKTLGLAAYARETCESIQFAIASARLASPKPSAECPILTSRSLRASITKTA